MKTETKADGPSLGIVLLVIGLAAIVFSRQIGTVGFTAPNDPGPRAFPIGIGIVLLLGGIAELVRALANRSRGPENSEAEESPHFLIDPRNRDLFLLIAGLLIYLPAISWIGFSVSTIVFSVLLMRRLGARWQLASAMSLILVLAVHLLFVRLFKVQLPVGILPLPF